MNEFPNPTKGKLGVGVLEGDHYYGLHEILQEALKLAESKGAEGVDWEAQRVCEIGRNLSPHYELGCAVDAIYSAGDAVREGLSPRQLLLSAILFTAAAALVSEG